MMNEITVATMPTEGKAPKRRISKKKLVIAGVVLILVIILGVVLVQRYPQLTGRSNAISETLVVGSTEEMGKVLEARQYAAAYYGLIDYLATSGGNAKTTANIVDTNISLAGLQLTVETTSPNRQFTMLIDGSVWDRLTLSVPQDNYQSTVSVYGESFPGTKIE